MNCLRVPETDVVIAVMRWLWSRQPRALPFQFSLPRGQGIDAEVDKRKLITAWKDLGITSKEPGFVDTGPDVIAISLSEFWQIECKGSGVGKQQTQRNNFDRALASCVSYYESKLPGDWSDITETSETKTRLGLALPNSADYIRELKRRVRKPLREQLGLWVLLYLPERTSIQAIAPNQDYG